ncbi:MAG: tetratricopeptide repeat protein, partial [Alphaproteobacteria bacterium]
MGTGAGGSLAKALKHHKAGRLARALSLYDAILTRTPGHLEVLLLAGQAARDLGDMARATHLLRRAFDLGRHHPAVCLTYGRLCLQESKTQEALAAYRQLATLTPEDAGVHRVLGDILQSLGLPEDSIACYEKSLALAPGATEVLFNLGLAFHRTGRPEAAIAEFRRIIALLPDFTEAYRSMGDALVNGGRLGEAADRYSRALTLKPDFAEVHANLSSVLVGLKRPEAAVASLHRAIRLNPQLARAYHALGIIRLEEGRLEEALVCYHRAITLAPDFQEAHFDRGNLLRLRGDFAAGWRDYEWRRQAVGSKADFAPFVSLPSWRGEILNGPLLMTAEQGVGEEILF